AVSPQRVIAIGDGTDSDKIWAVDVDTDQWTPITLPDPGVGTAPPVDVSVSYQDLAIDGNGRGLVIALTGVDSDVAASLRSIDATDPESITLEEVSSSTSSSIVSVDSTLLASDSGPRTILATPSGSGLIVELWSTETASLISTQSTQIDGSVELLGFDDQSGLLITRLSDGGVAVIDVNNNFAPLFELTDITGPVQLDASRELLWTVSPGDGSLSAIALTDGNEITKVTLEGSSAGTAAQILVGRTKTTTNNADAEDGTDPVDAIQSLAVVGNAGISEVLINQPAAQRVTLTDQDDASVRFGLLLTEPNQSPIYQSLPQLQTLEDHPLSLSAPTLLDGANDADGDRILVLQTGPATNGHATISLTGGLQYQPDENFNGDDAVPILLHDGRDFVAVSLPIEVAPVPDDPSDVIITTQPIPEDIVIRTPLGRIDIIDVDGGPHTILVDDPRIQGIGDELIFVGGDLDFENEPVIEINVTVIDQETDAVLTERVQLNITDANDPITGITPTSAFVFENAFGDVIAELTVEDQDAESFHTLTVDDERFVVEENFLRLAEGVAVDFESESEIVVNVTAKDEFNEDSFTEAITIVVRDLPEQPGSLSIDGSEVTEFVPGDVVGTLLIDGVANPNGYEFGVDDPGFEVVDGKLKLVDGVWVVRNDSAEIQLEITAQNDNSAITPLVETFVITVLANDQPFHNEDNPHDVNGDNEVTAQDALLIINYLNVHGPGPVGEGDPAIGYDVNGDGLVTALAVLLVLNAINRQDMLNNGGQGEQDGEGEGERFAEAPTPRSQDELGTQEDSAAPLRDRDAQQRFATDLQTDDPALRLSLAPASRVFGSAPSPSDVDAVIEWSSGVSEDQSDGESAESEWDAWLDSPDDSDGLA
ncbi:MAG: dockerin type I domain-containing protein, partial [Planctomycetota bacterium]